MIAIIDYDAGNLHNVEKAFRFLGREALVTDDRYVIEAADHVVLPGVGAFGDCMAGIRAKGLEKTIKRVIDRRTPFLGICLGMQLLFDESEESPGVAGLGIIPGKIRRIPDKGLKIPHMGWNDISCRGRLFEGLENPYVYFVHSYCLDAADKSVVSARTVYGVEIEVAVERDNLFATQFHPEKSGEAGLRMLSNFADMRREDF
ncbi:MAG: imidazole glycerol phosphate synthase subunit HisH [Clostridia bacterium]